MAEPARVLVTGASGCVGRYLVEAFLDTPGTRVAALVRDRARLPSGAFPDDRVETLVADLRDLDAYAGALSGTDAAVLAATAWGGEDTFAVTVDANLALADRLIEAGCRHIVYFATASVLGPDGALLAAAEARGTDYIRAKHRLVERMEERAGAARITGIFPTLVFGGRDEEPPIRHSHFANLAREVAGWARWLRFTGADGKFHVIHAADIAAVVRHLVGQGRGAGQGAERYVLGNPAATVDEMMGQLLAATGRRHRPAIRLRQGWIDPLSRVLPIELTPWDRYCASQPDQSHPNAVNPADFGLPVSMPDLRTGLASLGIDGR